jgi:hypothetical protein
VEQQIMDHPVYSTICRQQHDGRCHAPASFASLTYASKVEAKPQDTSAEPLYRIEATCVPLFHPQRRR